MIRFDIEWLDAPGVEDAVLAATWGRLEIAVEAVDGTHAVLTEAIDRAQRYRKGTYGAWYPLARWLVERYWHLLWEVPRAPRPASGRVLSRNAALAEWVRRHNLLAAREGYSLPDVSIANDTEFVVVAACPDPRPSPGRRPLTFIANGVFRVHRAAIARGIADFVDTVLDRLRDARCDDPHLATEWSAVLASCASEPDLCQWSARMGLDPYDPRDLSAGVLALLEEHAQALAPSTRDDVFDATSGAEELRQALPWVACNARGRAGLPSTRLRLAPSNERPAHRVGYERAAALRKHLGFRKSGNSVIAAVRGRLGFDVQAEELPVGDAPPALEALVAGNGNAPVIVGRALDHDMRVFRWARALYFWQSGGMATGPRLITRSHAREQRESRAFAAELLAPAADLRKRINRAVIGDAEIAALASEFAVGSLVIRHQIENHGIAIVAME